MKTGITLVGIVDNEVFNNYVGSLGDNLCKVPYRKSVSDRTKADNLPYHITLSAWDIKKKCEVLDAINNFHFDKLKVLVNDIDIMNGSNNSFVLCFNVEKNEQLKSIQEYLYDVCPSYRFNPEYYNFHITLHIGKDYRRIINMNNLLHDNFKPFEITIDKIGLYEIYPAELIREFDADKDKIYTKK